MTWTKLDDRWDDSEKLAAASEQVGDSAYALWSRAVTYCNRALTDGKVSGPKLRSLTAHKRPRLVIDALVSVGAFVDLGDDAYEIHDFLQWNDSREVVEARRQVKRAAASRGGAAASLARQGSAKAVAPCYSSGTPLECPSPSPTPTPTPTPGDERESKCEAHIDAPAPAPAPPMAIPEAPAMPGGAEAPSGAPADPSPPKTRQRRPRAPASPSGSVDVSAVWAAWLDARSQYHRASPAPVLTAARVDMLRRRLTEHPVEVLVDAVRGVWSSAWHRQAGHTGLELALRDAAHIERYGAYARGEADPEARPHNGAGPPVQRSAGGYDEERERVAREQWLATRVLSEEVV